MDYSTLALLLLIPAGFFAGVVNTIAGGGSFLTLPALMFLCGLEPQLANGTNRVAILLSSGSAAATFHRHGMVDRQLVWRLLVPTLIGVPLGALLAIRLPVSAFRPVFGAIFLAMSVVLMYRPALITGAERNPVAWRWLEYPTFCLIGVYIGFIQAGMGILLLLAMNGFHAKELLGANAVKNVLALVVTLAAMSFFVWHGHVAWIPGLTMAVGNLLGGFAGARLTISRGEKLVFTVLVMVMIATGLKLVLTGTPT